MNDVTTFEPLRLNVLLADDNEHTRAVLRFGLGKLNGALTPDGRQVELTIVEAANGAQAWTTLEADEFDLLVTDFYMPVLNGVELLERVRREPRLADLNVLFVTASPDDLVNAITLADTAGFLEKPFRAKELLRAVCELCGLVEATPVRAPDLGAMFAAA